LDAYRQWDKLSYLSIGDRVVGESTADPAGGNADGTHILRTLPDGERVLFDLVGPGIVTFMRMQETYGGPWRLYLDGADRATIRAGDLGQVQPTRFPATAFPYPLSMNSFQTQGSSIVAGPTPFKDGMRWTATTANGNYYALYDWLPYGAPLATWSGGEPVGDVVHLLRQAGSDIAPTNIAGRQGALYLPAGREATVVRLSSGPTQIRALQFRVPLAEQSRFGAARLHIYWDGETHPSVDAPIKFIAGDGAGVYQPAGRPLVRGLLVGAGGDGRTYMQFSLYWPMPFHATARIAISSATALSAIHWTVRYESFPDPPNWWGTFHATYTSVPKPRPGQDMTFLDVTGSGRIVGTVVNFSTVGSTLEGNPAIYLDDSRTPQIEVTGTEEWGLGGDYWHDGMQTSLPLGGLPSSTNNPPGTDVDGAALYRLLIADSIPFNRRAVIRWEHGGVDEGTNAYRAAVFWYGVPEQTALLSDTLGVGDASSRAAHAYRSPSQRRYRLTAAYEYAVHDPLVTGDGVSVTGTSTFRMALDPGNIGAFLRRTFDYGAANQRANIFIDGHFAGTWYSAGSFRGRDADGRQRRWREEDFPLPPALTAGKSAVTVRVQYVPTTDPPDHGWTEFSYRMYSFVLPGCPHASIRPPGR
jgi:hypothetical protein